jgi:hypothetical protein
MTTAWSFGLAALLAAAGTNQPPDIDHQAATCTAVGKPFQICATVTDDGQVAKARVFFRNAGDQFYSFVEMTFGGINFCAVLPAPREGKTKQIEYYIQAIDDAYDTQRTSTYPLAVKPEEACDFFQSVKPPIPPITVYATNKKQGKKLDDAFDPAGVTFVQK